MNKLQALEIGGKLWEKGSASRVYLSSEIIINLIKDSGMTSNITEFELSKINDKKTQVYFDNKSEKLISNVGAVRSLLNQCGISCGK